MAKKRVGTHARNTGPMMEAARCGASTRSGEPCRSPAVQSKKRCRMHGGAKGSGAPLGNQNALKLGLHTRELIEFRRQMASLMRNARETLRDIE